MIHPVLLRRRRSAARPLLSEIPPGLRRSAPRDVRLTAAGRAASVLAAALVLAGFASIIAFTRINTRDMSSGSATARVTEVREVREHRRQVRYTFAVQDRDWKGSVTLHRGDHREWHAGDTLGVHYLTSSPATNWANGYEPGRVPFFVTILLPFGFAAVAALIGLGMHRQRTLLSEGRAAVAHVIRGGKYRVSFEFKLLSGGMRKGGYTPETHQTPPTAGTPMVIVYMPDSPSRSARYPFTLYKVL